MKLIAKYFKEILVLILLWFILLTAMGCKKEEIKTNEPTQTPVEDCNCNAVISFTTFNIAGGDSFGDYVTQNPCTNVTGGGSWTATPPTIGECL